MSSLPTHRRWYVVSRHGRYGIRHGTDGADVYTDRRGQPYTRQSARRDAERYAAMDAGPRPLPERCGVCGRLTSAGALLRCRCEREP